MNAEPYPAQRQCANEMLDVFQQDGTRYVLLRAPLQSGKTGTYQYLIRRMFELGMIDQAYIICGSHEVELLNQVKMDVVEWHGKKKYEKKVIVLFRQHFKKASMITRRTLIINDESHLDCQTNQQLHQFMTRHQLTMAGTTERMLRNQVYIVSVSATPFAEESVMVHGDSYSKVRVQLAVDETYYGPAEYQRDNLLRPTFSVGTEQGRTDFTGLVQEVLNKDKYVMIRMREGISENKAVKRQVAIELGHVVQMSEGEAMMEIINGFEASGVRVVRFTSKFTKRKTQVVITTTEANKHYTDCHTHVTCLEETPVVPTIVLLDGRLRCGKRVPKSHIGMTWDSTAAANTDVTLQGLLGRLCGYRGPELYHVPLSIADRPIIYVGSQLIDRNEKATICLSELDRYVGAGIAVDVGDDPLVVSPLFIPRFANHLLRDKLETRMICPTSQQEVYQCVPIRFSLPAGVDGWFRDGDEKYDEQRRTDTEIRAMCLKAFVSQLDTLVRQNNDLTLVQKHEILSTVQGMGARDVHIRRFEGTSNPGLYLNMVQAVKDHTGLHKHRVEGGDFLTFCVVFEGYPGIQTSGSDDKAGDVYASIYTKTPGPTRTISIPYRVPYHNGLTHFIRSEADTEVPEQKMEVAGLYGFTSEICDTPSRFEEQFAHFIGLARSGIGHFGQVFSSVGSSEGIRLSLEAYGDKLHVLRAMKMRLEAKYDVRIHYRPRPLTEKSTHVYLPRIWWE